MATDRDADYVRALLRDMPKVELPLHLDGSMRVSTALDLARRHGVEGPRTFRTMYDALVPDAKLASQRELLAAFGWPVALLQSAEALRRAATELVVDKHHDGVVYIEIKWAPTLHLEDGLDLDDVIGAVSDGARAGESATGCVARLVPVLVRSDPADVNRDVVAAAARARHRGVVGIDVAGDEQAYPLRRDHGDVLASAAAAGLGITVHCGELQDGGHGIRAALEIPLRRIEHGANVRPGSSLVTTLIERGITLDMCPTSNVQAATVATLSEHPIVALHRQGLAVTISTDDPTISAITQTDEMWNVWRWCGASVQELWAMNRAAADAAFADESTRRQLLERLDAWERTVPDVAVPDVAVPERRRDPSR
jgi:adenosine deaminase